MRLQEEEYWRARREVLRKHEEDVKRQAEINGIFQRGEAVDVSSREDAKIPLRL